MPTDIYFAGSVRVTVREEPEQVADALGSADGRPVRLTDPDGQEVVYVNPGAVAFWGASEPAYRPEEESEPVRLPRDTVTTIWGKPVQKKPRS